MGAISMHTRLRIFFVAVSLLAACLIWGTATHAQAPKRAVEGEDQYRYAMTVVNAVLAEPDGFHSTFVENPVGRLGDSASVAVIKLRNREQLSDPKLVAKVLSIIRAAFAGPCIIDLEVDRTPNATLLLLQSLASQTKEERLKHQIDETAAYVRLAASQKCAASQD